MSGDQPRDWAALIRQASVTEDGTDQPDVVTVHLPSLVELLEAAGPSSPSTPPKPSNSPLLNVVEAAERLRVHPKTLAVRLRHGLVPDFCYYQSVARSPYQISAAAVRYCQVYGDWPKNRRKLSQFIRETEPSSDTAWKRMIEAKLAHLYEHLGLV